MSLDIEEVLRGARAVKEMKVADAFSESAKPSWGALDLRPSLVLWRAGREVVTIHTRNRDHALRAARSGVPNYGADELAMVMDTFMAKPKWFTDRNRSPKPDELGRQLRERGRNDLVTEAMLVVWVNRLGVCVGVTLPFEIDVAGQALSWGEREHMDENEHVRIAGLIPDELRASFEIEQAMVTLRSAGLDPVDFNLTEEQARLEADIANARAMARLGYFVRLASYTRADAARIKECLDADGQVGYYRVGPDGMSSKPWPDEN